MCLSFREQLLLDRIRQAVSRSDPRLASMLAIFSLLTAAEEMPDREQLHAPAGWTEAAKRAAAIAVSMLMSWAAALRARVRRAWRAAHPKSPVSPVTFPHQ
jgi:xanthine/CO dehydrogenase XdhC/CoxF family maturation factor